MTNISKLKVKIFADGADKQSMLELYSKPYIKGFTTNPSLMCKAGIKDYAGFAKDILKTIPDRPISFEVFSDDYEGMLREAKIIATWGDNVYVKIPVINTKGESTCPLIEKLSNEGIKTNVTAIFNIEKVPPVIEALKNSPGAYISLFAGRVADTGVDPLPMMKEAVKLMAPNPKLELIWASTRELINIMQADAIGCHVITVGKSVLDLIPSVGKDLNQVTLDAVKKFREDSLSAGFSL